MGDLGDLFGGLFGRGPPGRGRPTGPQRGADVETELHLSFEDAVNGVTTSVNLTTDVRCHTCHGSGAAPGTQPMTCPRCGGTGTLQDNQGLFSLSQICPQCGGRGTIVTTPCPTCSGTGVEHRNRSVKVRIPPGWRTASASGSRAGARPGAATRPSGDLYVVVRVDRHGAVRPPGPQPDPHRAGLLPRGRPRAPPSPCPPSTDPVTLRVPAGTPSGRTFRVKGRGVPGRQEERHRRPAGHRRGGRARDS